MIRDILWLIWWYFKGRYDHAKECKVLDVQIEKLKKEIAALK